LFSLRLGGLAGVLKVSRQAAKLQREKKEESHGQYFLKQLTLSLCNDFEFLCKAPLR